MWIFSLSNFEIKELYQPSLFQLFFIIVIGSSSSVYSHSHRCRVDIE